MIENIELKNNGINSPDYNLSLINNGIFKNLKFSMRENYEIHRMGSDDKKRFIESILQEEIEQVGENLFELKGATLKSYVKKAADDMSDRKSLSNHLYKKGDEANKKGDEESTEMYDKMGDEAEKKATQRKKGISTALDKLSEEDKQFYKDLVDSINIEDINEEEDQDDGTPNSDNKLWTVQMSKNGKMFTKTMRGLKQADVIQKIHASGFSLVSIRLAGRQTATT